MTGENKGNSPGQELYSTITGRKFSRTVCLVRRGQGGPQHRRGNLKLNHIEVPFLLTVTPWFPDTSLPLHDGPRSISGTARACVLYHTRDCWDGCRLLAIRRYVMICNDFFLLAIFAM